MNQTNAAVGKTVSTDDERVKTVLVLGATGKSGRRLVPRLRLQGTEVRAASRSGTTLFDWSDPSGWETALRGVDAV